MAVIEISNKDSGKITLAEIDAEVNPSGGFNLKLDDNSAVDLVQSLISVCTTGIAGVDIDRTPMWAYGPDTEGVGLQGVEFTNTPKNDTVMLFNNPDDIAYNSLCLFALAVLSRQKADAEARMRKQNGGDCGCGRDGDCGCSRDDDCDCGSDCRCK